MISKCHNCATSVICILTLRMIAMNAVVNGAVLVPLHIATRVLLGKRVLIVATGAAMNASMMMEGRILKRIPKSATVAKSTRAKIKNKLLNVRLGNLGAVIDIPKQITRY